MVAIRRLVLSPPLINSSSPSASEPNQLRELFESPHTGAVTTRTATLTGFSETSEHTVAFTNNSISSVNSYGYSPHPLSAYIGYVDTILSSTPEHSIKPFIISITSSSPISLASMLDAIQELRANCPNIKGSPPPAYNISGLSASGRTRRWTIGLKLPPYVYSTQFDDLVGCIATYSRPDPNDDSRRLNPFAFLASTNTLGQTLLFAEQAAPAPLSVVADSDGGAAPARLHPLALGNVYTLRRLLDAHADTSLCDISIIGVGGVTTREAHARMRKAGAAVVACATVLVREGVSVFEKLSILSDGGD
ncbi:FMN-linked oxidoreductase [Lactarius hatsudake]|nr:FMN-linked oxidoreductase [Lactarius hatsudake]